MHARAAFHKGRTAAAARTKYKVGIFTLSSAPVARNAAAMARGAAGSFLPALALCVALAAVSQAAASDECPLRKLLWQAKPLVRGCAWLAGRLAWRR